MIIPDNIDIRSYLFVPQRDDLYRYPLNKQRKNKNYIKESETLKVARNFGDSSQQHW